MFKVPCPYCDAVLATPRGAPGKKGKCPGCRRTVHLLAVDNTDFQALFPYVKWCPGDAALCSKEHAALAGCGIGGGPYFEREDPVLAPWWAARRMGLPACGCKLVPISKWEAVKLRLHPGRVAPLPFDPWGPAARCGVPESEEVVLLER